MGLDKSNVRWVAHADLPQTIEGYYQEIGRAGRDSKPAKTLTLYSYEDIQYRRDQIDEGTLTQDFFKQLHKNLRDDILLILAEIDGKFVAGALNFIGRETLFGRYWGCIEDFPCLHFELC